MSLADDLRAKVDGAFENIGGFDGSDSHVMWLCATLYECTAALIESNEKIASDQLETVKQRYADIDETDAMQFSRHQLFEAALLTKMDAAINQRRADAETGESK